MKRYFKIYIQFLKQYIKTLIEYKEDFMYGLLGFFLIQVTSLIFIGLVFNNIQTLKGWGFYQIIFIYGFSQIPRGIDHIFTDYLWIFSGHGVKDGELDRYLLRPLNPLFQVIAQRFQPDGFGEVIVGFILIVFSGMNLQIKVTPILILGFFIAVIGGTLIYTAIKLAAASIAFWTKTSFRHLQIVYELSGFSKYPVTMYPGIIKNFLTYVIPFAFTGFYPGAYLLGKEGFFIGVIATLIIGIISICVAYLIWLKGLSVYESVGN